MNQMNMPTSGSRHFRFGTENPTIMEEPFWKYMICNRELTGCDAWSTVNRDRYLPMWCFARFGATQTYLPDGRLICIGGEHEDSYDPDFQIYNDVVVIKNPQIVKGHGCYETPIPRNFPGAKEIQKKRYDGRMLGTSNVEDITIYGYPLNVFPPTDFHTATYVRMKGKEFIYIIGGTGCTCGGTHKPEPCKSDENHIKETRIFRLCVSDFSIERVETTGNVPRGCTYAHRPKLLRVNDRPFIEIELSPVVVSMCKSPGWENHHRVYRLDIETVKGNVLVIRIECYQ